jgi:hypothetical protein
MRASPYLLTASAISSLAFAHLELGKRADFEAAGIKRNEEGFGSEPVFQNDEPAAFLEALRDEKNLTVPLLQDRSMELYGRQSCETGYWYCSGEFPILPFRLSTVTERISQHSEDAAPAPQTVALMAIVSTLAILAVPEARAQPDLPAAAKQAVLPEGPSAAQMATTVKPAINA